MLNQLNVESVGVYRRVGRVSVDSEGLKAWTINGVSIGFRQNKTIGIRSRKRRTSGTVKGTVRRSELHLSRERAGGAERALVRGRGQEGEETLVIKGVANCPALNQ